MRRFYRLLLCLLQAVGLFGFTLFEWALTWWVFMAFLGSQHIFILLVFFLNIALTTYFLIWCGKNYYRYDNHIVQVAVLCVFLLVCFGIYKFEGSSQWVFMDLTDALGNFVGTISYMFNYTRVHTDILKVYGYLGSGLLGVWTVIASYAWLLIFARFVKFRKS